MIPEWFNTIYNVLIGTLINGIGIIGDIYTKIDGAVNTILTYVYLMTPPLLHAPLTFFFTAFVIIVVAKLIKLILDAVPIV